MTLSDIVQDVDCLLEDSLAELGVVKKGTYEHGETVGYREGLMMLRRLLTSCPDFESSDDIYVDDGLDNVLKRGVY